MKLRDLVIGAAAGLSGAACAQSFSGLGILPGATGSAASGVSESGAVVVGATVGGNEHAWRWTPTGGIQSLGFAGRAFGISADGQVVAGTQGTLLPHEAVRWTQAGGVQPLGFLIGTDTLSDAMAASGNGSVLVGRSGRTPPFTSQAFRWTVGGGMVGLGYLAPTHAFSDAWGVSADGSVVVGASRQTSSGTPAEAYRWTAGSGMVGLGYLAGDNSSVATAVSADGAVVVGGSFVYNGIGGRPFRWTQETGMQGLGSLPGYTSCTPLAVSADGSIIVGACQGGGDVAFIWTSGGGIRSLATELISVYSLSLSGWQLVEARTMSADGRAIVGSAINAHGQREAFLAVLAAPCYANCDASTTPPVLNIADFTCFLNLFATGDSRANCDASTVAPVLNIADFTCFLNRFAAGCS